MASTTTLTIFLGLLALTTTLLSFNAEARPQPSFEDDEHGTIVGPYADLDDDMGTIVGPEFEINRKDFPDDFIFGTSVSAYQVEGAKKGSGRGLTSWDEFTHMFPDKISQSGDGDQGVDFYSRYPDDIKLMKELNTNGFRFSISWTRVLPYGRLDHVNKEGVDYYHRLIDALKDNGIEPAITLFHWESPLALELEYGGFLNEKIVEDFREFSKFCFNEYGGKVKNWATFNEPSVYSVAGYSKGKKAPGRCSAWDISKCPIGDSSIEPYLVGRHQILAHAAAADEFRKCKKCQDIGGKIGIVVVTHWFEPQNPKSAIDVEAARRSLEYVLGWFLRPLVYGQYPAEMLQDDVAGRIKPFTPEESNKLRGSLDFVGLNYYGAMFSTPLASVNSSQISYASDLRVNWTVEQNHSPHLRSTAMGIVIYPQGLLNVLKHIKDEYMDPEIYIMENGMDEIDEGTKTLAEATNDYGRKEFIKSHILIMGKAIKMYNVKMKGYFIWSLMDNFEWEKGYRIRFGLYYVDFKDNMKRYMRSSGKWLREFLSPASSESLHKCYFEGHREKGYAPKLSDVEILEPDNKHIRYESDFM